MSEGGEIIKNPDDLLFGDSAPKRSKKKKQIKEGINKKNLFVRNLPITATSQALEDVFSNIGPIKRCFVITDTENHNICAGYGFVHFAQEGDATKALRQLQGHLLEGKNIIVERAVSRESRNYIPKSKRVELDDENDGDENVEDSDEDMAPIEAPVVQKKQKTQTLKMYVF